MSALGVPRPVLPKRFGAGPRAGNPWRPSWLGICPSCAEQLDAKRQAVHEQLAAAGALIFRTEVPK